MFSEAIFEHYVYGLKTIVAHRTAKMERFVVQPRTLLT